MDARAARPVHRPLRDGRRGAHRRRAVALVAAAVALLMSGCTAADPVVLPTAEAPLRVVSLGDSYSTGTGPADPVPGDPGVCGRTVAGSIRVAAAEVGADLVDAACDGATTAELTAPGERGGQRVPAQLDALTDGADVVLVRLGGNDLGFPALVGGCLARDAATRMDPATVRPHTPGSPGTGSAGPVPVE
jgi:lysophospholipase L1-like esterase